MRIDGIGVPQLDKIVCPIPRHAALLFAHDPGVEAEAFLYHAAHRRLSEGGEVVYVVTNRAPGAVLAQMHAYGLDVLEHRSRLRFIDAYSGLVGGAEGMDVVDKPQDPLRVVEAIERQAGERPDAWLFVDSLSTILDHAQDRFVEAFPRAQAAMRRFSFSASLFTRWPYGPEVAPLLASFDGVIGVHGVEDRVTTGQYFVAERAAWLPGLAPRPRPFKALKPGGVHVYIPKIVVTGPYNAGKSSFVHSVSDTAVSADELGTTVALDHGRATLDGLTADIFGTPGQTRFDPLLRIVAGQALGVIVVVDSAKPESFPRAREMLDATWRQGLPGIIAANKQDLPDAMRPEDVARLIDPPPRVRVVGCTGEERDSARRVLKLLIDQILEAHAQEAPA